MPVFKKTFTIRYEDVDPYNRLTPSSLTRYLLDVGSAHSDSCGYGYNDIPVTHAVWIILNWKIELYQTLIMQIKLPFAHGLERQFVPFVIVIMKF